MKKSSDLLGVKIVGGLKETSTPWAGAAALPANPTGYAKIKVGGTVFVAPYYNAA